MLFVVPGSMPGLVCGRRFHRNLQHALRSAALAALVVTGVSACERKAPGPLDCERFSHRLFGIRDPRQLAVPILRERVDQMTVRCILTPYDRELVACVERGNAETCMAEFRMRHPERVARELPVRVRN
jgi:hypothetical protein